MLSNNLTLFSLFIICSTSNKNLVTCVYFITFWDAEINDYYLLTGLLGLYKEIGSPVVLYGPSLQASCMKVRALYFQAGAEWPG